MNELHMRDAKGLMSLIERRISCHHMRDTPLGLFRYINNKCRSIAGIPFQRWEYHAPQTDKKE